MAKKEIENVIINIDLAPSEIVLGKLIIRKVIDADHLVEVQESIKKIGILHPLSVMKIGQHYELIAGLCRFTAAQNLHLKKIPCRVLNVDSDAAVRIGIEENAIRRNVNPFDEGEYFKEVMIDMKITQKGLARMIGRSEAYVSERVKLTTCLAAASDAVRAGKLSMSSALEISKCNDTKDALNILETVLENGASEKVIKYWVQQANVKTTYAENTFQENEVIPELPAKYEAPEVFCDLCEHKTEWISSKWIRVCVDCYNLAKANLKE